MLYANVYEYDGPLGEFQFTGNHHTIRAAADRAAEWELSVEKNTRRLGVLHIKLKAGVE